LFTGDENYNKKRALSEVEEKNSGNKNLKGKYLPFKNQNRYSNKNKNKSIQLERI
jgi:hypothetical protein